MFNLNCQTFKISIVITVLLAFLTACGGSSQTSTEQVSDPTPDIIDTAPDDNTETNTSNTAEYTFSVASHAENSLMANVTVTTANDSTVVIQFDSVNIPVRQTLSSELGTEHSFTIVGLRANTSYSFSALLTAANGETIVSDAQTFATGSLPSDAPSVELLTNNENGVGGITFFAANEPPSRFYGVDQGGQYVWYLDGDDIPMSASPTIKALGGGRLMLLLTREVRIIDLTGKVLESFTLPAYHHDVILLDNGNLLVLTYESATVNNEVLKGDMILELDPQGNTAWQWSAFDHLDTSRFPGTLSNRVNDGQKDWTHGNAIFYQSHDDTIFFPVVHKVGWSTLITPPVNYYGLWAVMREQRMLIRENSSVLIAVTGWQINTLLC